MTRELAREQLERASRPGAFQEPERAVERRRGARVVGEELALEVEKRGRGVTVIRSRQLLDAPGGQAREIADRALQSRKRGSAGLVRDRHGHLRPRGERLQQRPLRCGQVFEAVREDGLAVPGLEIVREALDRAPAEPFPIS